MKGSGATCRLRVNGQLATTGATWTMANDGAIYYVPVTVGSAALRKITLELPSNALWGGTQIGLQDLFYAPDSRVPK